MIVNCDMFSKHIQAQGVQCEKILKSTNALAIRIAPFLRWVIPSYNINEAINNSKDDTIIVFDSGINDSKILKYISKKNSDKRLIFYYWNPVGVSFPVKNVPKEYEIWSYSPSDCEKYSLKYNSTFYFPEFVTSVEASCDSDVSFIGKDKGRYPVLMRYKGLFEKSGLITDFYITATHPKIDRSKPASMSYTDSIKRMQKSKCIFDYYNDPKTGLSLRMMEALYFGKKIITNNLRASEYNFYRQENVMIVENANDEKDFLTFINAPLHEVSQEIKDYYSFMNWMKRF